MFPLEFMLKGTIQTFTERLIAQCMAQYLWEEISFKYIRITTVKRFILSITFF